MFTRDATTYISIDEMNDQLKYVRKTYKLTDGSKNPGDVFGRTAYYEDKHVTFHLTYKKGSKVNTYICYKDSRYTEHRANPMEAYRILCTYYKVPKMNPEICGSVEEGGLSAAPLLWFNPKYEKQWITAYAYDMNSAYANAMLQRMPDTSKRSRSGIIKPGAEIGFRENENPATGRNMLEAVYKGYARYIFPLMESPFDRFIDRWYTIKRDSPKGSEEREKAKGVLNYSVGWLQRTNPFLRATIVCYCNDTMRKLIDPETTLLCNTDSIVSTVPLDLPIGTNVGEWKLEHNGDKIAYVGNNYQWSDGTTCYRGIPKTWFKRGWDITKDPLPEMGNVVEFKNGRLIYV